MPDLNLKKVRVKDLKFAPYNPRKMDEFELNKLKDSIVYFGYIEPIVYNKRTMHVVGGNQRLKVLQELGIEEIEAVEVDLSEEEEKALNLALNRISGNWDLLKLQNLLQELGNTDYLSLTGFRDEELYFFTEPFEPVGDMTIKEDIEAVPTSKFQLVIEFPTVEEGNSFLKEFNLPYAFIKGRRKTIKISYAELLQKIRK